MKLNISVSVGLLVLAALLTFSVIATRKRYPKTSKNLFAALMIAVLFFSAASTSPTLVKALDEITTIATITDKATDTITTEFTDTPYYEGQTPPSEITAVIDGKTVTFTNLQMVNERTDPNGPYTLVDSSGNTLYFYEGSLIPGDEMAEGQGWVLIIPDGNGGAITVPAHNIQFGEAEIPKLEPEPEGEEILYITVIDGTTRVFTFTGDTSLREVLSKACSNTIYLQSDSDTTIDEEHIPGDWVLRIYYGEGEGDFIEVPAHEVQLGGSSTALSAGGKYYSYEGGTLTEHTWTGGEATFAGVNRLFFSLAKPGSALWIGTDPNNPALTGLDGNDIIEYSKDESNNDKFTIFFDLDSITDFGGVEDKVKDKVEILKNSKSMLHRSSAADTYISLQNSQEEF
jgi:hypothetical protein